MATSDEFPEPRGDEAELFRSFNDELLRDIARAVRVRSPHTVEDACAFAWMEFMRHQPDRDLNWRGWLFRTAQRQAWTIERESRQTLALRDFEWEQFGPTRDAVGPDTTQINRDVQDALDLIGELPPRLQRIALMRGLGL